MHCRETRPRARTGAAGAAAVARGERRRPRGSGAEGGVGGWKGVGGGEGCGGGGGDGKMDCPEPCLARRACQESDGRPHGCARTTAPRRLVGGLGSGRYFARHAHPPSHPTRFALLTLLTLRTRRSRRAPFTQLSHVSGKGMSHAVAAVASHLAVHGGFRTLYSKRVVAPYEHLRNLGRSTRSWRPCRGQQ